MRTKRRKFLTFNGPATDPLLPESEPYHLPEQPPNIYKLTAWGICFAIFVGFAMGVIASTAVGVTVHFLTK